MQPLPAKDDAIQKWVEEWSENYDQSFDEIKLKGYVGKRVHAERPARDDEDGPKGIDANIIGYEMTFIVHNDVTTRRCSLLTDEGISFPIFTGMTIAESSDA